MGTSEKSPSPEGLPQAIVDPAVSMYGIAAYSVLAHIRHGSLRDRARTAGVPFHDLARGVRELRDAGYATPSVPGDCPRGGKHQGAELLLAALVDGRWAYKLIAHHHEADPLVHEEFAGVAATVTEITAAHEDSCCPVVDVRGRLTAKHQRRIARQATDVPVMGEPPDYQVVVPERYRDPWLVASDASYEHATGRGTWAVVTGAGWVRTGTYELDLAKGAVSMFGELVAATQALRTYPRGSVVRYLSDSESLINLISDARTAIGRSRKPASLNRPWLDQQRDVLLTVLGQQAALASWEPRTHPMIRIADYYTRGDTPTHRETRVGPDVLFAAVTR